MKPEVCLVSQEGQWHHVRNTVASMTQEVICPFVHTWNTVFCFGPLTTGRLFGYSGVCRDEWLKYLALMVRCYWDILKVEGLFSKMNGLKIKIFEEWLRKLGLFCIEKRSRGGASLLLVERRLKWRECPASFLKFQVIGCEERDQGRLRQYIKKNFFMVKHQNSPPTKVMVSPSLNVFGKCEHDTKECG